MPDMTLFLEIKCLPGDKLTALGQWFVCTGKDIYLVHGFAFAFPICTG